MAMRGWRGRGRGGFRGRGRGNWRKAKEEKIPSLMPVKMVRPIFDWSEVGDTFYPATQQLDYTFLTQLLSKRVQDITPSIEENTAVQNFFTKVHTVIQNMILTGEGEELLLDEVRQVGSMKTTTSLAGNMVADLVILLREVPNPSIVTKVCYKISETLNNISEEHKEADGEESDGVITVQILSEYVFELTNAKNAIVRVYVTTVGSNIYNSNTADSESLKPFKNHLRMIRHARWWDENAAHIKSIPSLVRILKDMKQHVPGLRCLNPWYLQLLANCAVTPLVGDLPYTVVDAFRRVWELLAAGLFLPGSIGIPDPCEEGDHGIHESLSALDCDELTRNAQTILMMLSFGAYREILIMDGASPINFDKPYSFAGVTLDVAPPVGSPKDGDASST